MKGRRTIAAENRALQARLDECLALLGAAALDYGVHGQLRIHDDSLQAATDSDRTVSVKRLEGGDFRIDCVAPQKPELVMVVDEAPAEC